MPNGQYWVFKYGDAGDTSGVLSNSFTAIFQYFLARQVTRGNKVLVLRLTARPEYMVVYTNRSEISREMTLA